MPLGFRQVGSAQLAQLSALQSALHINPVPCLVVGRDGPVTLQTPVGRLSSMVVLADCRTPHIIDSSSDVLIAFLEHPKAQSLPMTTFDRSVRQTLPIQISEWCADHVDWLYQLLKLDALTDDNEMRQIVEHIEADPMNRLCAVEAMAISGLERTTFLKRFKRYTGMTFRRFKSWSAFKHASRQLEEGQSLGTVALDAGFADAAHFSRYCRQGFGYAPSTIRSLLPGLS